jgi:hypothetical protein
MFAPVRLIVIAAFTGELPSAFRRDAEIGHDRCPVAEALLQRPNCVLMLIKAGSLAISGGQARRVFTIMTNFRMVAPLIGGPDLVLSDLAPKYDLLASDCR